LSGTNREEQKNDETEQQCGMQIYYYRYCRTGVLFAPEARACGTRPGEAGLAASRLFAPLLEFQTPPSTAQAQTALADGQDPEQDHSGCHHAPIVGMWIAHFYIGTTSQLYDIAIEQFYADGNEMTNDIAVPPATENVCYGVWEHAANRTFKLKHLGWVFDANGTFIGRFVLTATLDVDNDGDAFRGTYVADQKDLSGNIIPAYHAEGVLKARRFKID
jgi:hypothetical protein